MYEWLDKIAAEQAVYYGTTPEKLALYMSRMANQQEAIENTQIDETERKS